MCKCDSICLKMGIKKYKKIFKQNSIHIDTINIQISLTQFNNLKSKI